MKNVRSKLKQKFNKLKVVKRKVKFLDVALDLEVAKAVLQKAPNAVTEAISNAAVNARQGAVTLPPHLKQLFSHSNDYFDFLIDQKNSITFKRHVIFQKCGALLIIVPLLSTVLR